MLIILSNPVQSAILDICANKKLTTKQISHTLDFFSKEALSNELYNLNRNKLIMLSEASNSIVAEVPKETADIYALFKNGVQTDRGFNKKDIKNEIAEFVLSYAKEKIIGFNLQHEMVCKKMRFFVEDLDASKMD